MVRWKELSELIQRDGVQKLKCGCCCSAHCAVSFHNLYRSKVYAHPILQFEKFELVGTLEEDLLQEDDLQMDEEIPMMDEDNFMAHNMRTLN